MSRHPNEFVRNYLCKFLSSYLGTLLCGYEIATERESHFIVQEILTENFC